MAVEAQAAISSVLVADKGGLPETVKESRFVIKGFDPDMWLVRIHELLQRKTADLQENGIKIRFYFGQREHDRIINSALESILSEQN